MEAAIKMGTYFQVGDVQTLRPEWSHQRCEDFILSQSKYFTDRLTELGWEVMDVLVCQYENEIKEKEGV